MNVYSKLINRVLQNITNYYQTISENNFEARVLKPIQEKYLLTTGCKERVITVIESFDKDMLGKILTMQKELVREQVNLRSKIAIHGDVCKLHVYECTNLPYAPIVDITSMDRCQSMKAIIKSVHENMVRHFYDSFLSCHIVVLSGSKCFFLAYHNHIIYDRRFNYKRYFDATIVRSRKLIQTGHDRGNLISPVSIDHRHGYYRKYIRLVNEITSKFGSSDDTIQQMTFKVCARSVLRQSIKSAVDYIIPSVAQCFSELLGSIQLPICVLFDENKEVGQGYSTSISDNHLEAHIIYERHNPGNLMKLYRKEKEGHHNSVYTFNQALRNSGFSYNNTFSDLLILNIVYRYAKAKSTNNFYAYATSLKKSSVQEIAVKAEIDVFSAEIHFSISHHCKYSYVLADLGEKLQKIWIDHS